MIVYREATVQDTERIAALHALSWQQHYRGILLDEFLDNKVKDNRLELWQGRLQNPKETQYIMVAEEQHTLYGFVCVFANADSKWGALVDNLHVLSPQKGQGIGTRLIKAAADWANTHKKNTSLYLWVYKQNVKAIGFYESIGGTNQEEVIEENPGGGHATICRYVWPDIKKLIELA